MRRSEWNEQADAFESEVCDIADEEIGDELKQLVAVVRPSPRTSVLVDLGCGLGSFILKFGNRFQQVYALDFADRILARAKQRCAGMPRIEWLAMDMGRAAERIGPIADLLVCLNVITSPSVARRNLLWANVSACTRPGGHALIVVPSIESHTMVETRASRRPGHTTILPDADGVVLREETPQKHYTEEELVSTGERHGFRLKRVVRVPYPWSTEGMRKPRGTDAGSPWDWAYLGQKTQGTQSSRAASKAVDKAGARKRAANPAGS